VKIASLPPSRCCLFAEWITVFAHTVYRSGLEPQHERRYLSLAWVVLWRDYIALTSIQASSQDYSWPRSLMALITQLSSRDWFEIRERHASRLPWASAHRSSYLHSLLFHLDSATRLWRRFTTNLNFSNCQSMTAFLALSSSFSPWNKWACSECWSWDLASIRNRTRDAGASTIPSCIRPARFD
jgi:hypothetical protein